MSDSIQSLQPQSRLEKTSDLNSLNLVWKLMFLFHILLSEATTVYKLTSNLTVKMVLSSLLEEKLV